VEDTTGQYKPLEKVFLPEKPSIPQLQVETAEEFPGLSPFYSREEATVLSRKKEEREALQITKAKKDHRPGWCECCNSNYKNYDQHINSDKHQNFACNSSNYTQIDGFIEMLNKSKSVE